MCGVSEFLLCFCCASTKALLTTSTVYCKATLDSARPYVRRFRERRNGAKVRGSGDSRDGETGGTAGTRGSGKATTRNDGGAGLGSGLVLAWFWLGSGLVVWGESVRSGGPHKWMDGCEVHLCFCFVVVERGRRNEVRRDGWVLLRMGMQ